MKMKSRKIWSVPIAVLALALMLAGALAVSGIVQAQTAPSLESSNIKVAVNGDAAVAEVLASIVVVTETGEDALLVPGIPAALDDPQTPVNEARAAFVNPAILGGPTFIDDEADDTRKPLFVLGTNTSLDAPFTVSLNTAAGNTDLKESSYSFRVRLILDADGEDGDDADLLLERDITLTANVTINVMRVTENALNFDVDPTKSVKGAVVSGIHRPIATNPLQYEVTGIGSSAKLVEIQLDGVVGPFQLKETPAGSGKFILYVLTSGAPTIPDTFSVELTYDQDTAVDSDDLEATAKDANDNVTITLTGVIRSRIALAFTGTLFGDGETDATDGDPNTDGIHFEFTVPSNTVASTPIGFFGVTNGIPAVVDDNDDGEDTAVAAEYLDGIVSGADSAPFDVRDSDMTLVYKGSPALEVKTYTLDLTVSGDAGLANRTIIGKATVTVTASNLAPDAPPTFSATIKENEPGIDVVAAAGPPAVERVAGLVKPDTVVGNASVGVVANDGDSLTYLPSGSGASVFAIDSSTGMITVGAAGILDTTGGPDDDPATDDEDTKYERGTDNGVLVDDTDEFSDITYTFKVKVTDGISANDKYIDATVTVDVNEPPEVDRSTEMTDDDGNKYFAATYTDTDPFGTTIFDMATVLTDDQMASDLDYKMVVTGLKTLRPRPSLSMIPVLSSSTSLESCGERTTGWLISR